MLTKYDTLLLIHVFKTNLSKKKYFEKKNLSVHFVYFLLFFFFFLVYKKKKKKSHYMCKVCMMKLVTIYSFFITFMLNAWYKIKCYLISKPILKIKLPNKQTKTFPTHSRWKTKNNIAWFFFPNNSIVISS